LRFVTHSLRKNTNSATACAIRSTSSKMPARQPPPELGDERMSRHGAFGLLTIRTEEEEPHVEHPRGDLAGAVAARVGKRLHAWQLHLRTPGDCDRVVP